MTQAEIVALLASRQELTHSVAELDARCTDLQQQLDWLKRQMFGVRSERRLLEADARQLFLGETATPPPPDNVISVTEHQRRTRGPRQQESAGEPALRFDDTVPVEEIRLTPPAVDDEHEVVSEKVTYRLAQRPASYVVLKYIRPVVKRKADGALSSAPAPAAVLGKSVADVSFLACLAIDKFRYHLPLHRQHQRLRAAGIRLARSTLTGLVHRTGDLLRPIYEAQMVSVLTSRVKAMDETPIRAGRKDHGRMQTGYFWPIYGEQDEVVFPFSTSRSGESLRAILGAGEGVLLTDGYAAYEKYAASQQGLVHAQCWSHTRRQFVQAQDVEPELAGKALDAIGSLYAAEDRLGKRWADPGKRLEERAERCKPIVDEFFEWLKMTLSERVLLPRNPFTVAAGYALAREGPLRVFLEDPDVPLDTNHLERQIRPIAVGRKNWLFCWSEVGAEYVGIFQSLLSTCRLQGVDPYTYLVDVLQRVDRHPALDVAELTPRLWKQQFAGEPLRSDIDRPVNNAGP